jgi:hypothetical protein
MFIFRSILAVELHFLASAVLFKKEEVRRVEKRDDGDGGEEGRQSTTYERVEQE